MNSPKKSFYTYCIVPLCKNTTVSTPDKHFFHVPKNPILRKKWFKLMRRDRKGYVLSNKTVAYCCEDHFNLEEDTDNYMEYKIMHDIEGRKVTLRLKKGVLPHIFLSQNRNITPHAQEHDNTIKLKINQEQDLKLDENKHVVKIEPNEYCNMDFSTTQTYEEVHLENQTVYEGHQIKKEQIKQENDCIVLDKNKYVQKIEPNESCNINFAIKQEEMKPNLQALYEGHQIKEEVILGPTILIKPTQTIQIALQSEATKRLIPISQLPNNIGGMSDNIDLFNKQTDEKESVVLHRYKKSFKCDLCGKEFAHKGSLNNHRPSHIGEKLYKCDMCTKQFRLKWSLKSHMKIHTGEKPYKCHLCKRHFSRKASLNRHVNIHVGEKRFKCSLCTSKFGQKASLNRHMVIHTGDKRYKCDLCSKLFSSKGCLIRHVRIHTGEKPYKCDLCKKQFSYKRSLHSHRILRHLGQKPFKCDLCQKRFLLKRSLYLHMSIHSSKMPFKCDLCKEHFKNKDNLISHIQSHKAKKLLKCNLCNKHFTIQCKLNSHMLFHMNEKPYMCDLCKQQFDSKDSLNLHIQSHMGEKPFKCNLCKTQFTKKSELDSHMLFHVNEKPYKCDLCKQQFFLKVSLDSHILLIHKR